MGRSIDAFNVIAADIGVIRYSCEDEDSFCRRVAYSAARFWLSAFCMDDGASGEEGLVKQALDRRLKDWAQGLEAIRPGIEGWLDACGKGVSAIYNRLIDVGDLAPNGFRGTYTATIPSLVPLSESASCITGFFDITSRNGSLCGCGVDSIVTSGLLSLIRVENGPIERPEQWWAKDLEYMAWEKASGYDEVKYADLHTTRWNVNRSDIWVEAPEWIEGLALARVEGNGAVPVVFVAKRMQGRLRLSRITWNQAQELFFHLRRESGNGAVVKYVMLDDLHARAVLPIGFVPGHINRFLDAAGWPIENADDRFKRIVRVEALPLIKELLAASSIGFEEISYGKQ